MPCAIAQRKPAPPPVSAPPPVVGLSTSVRRGETIDIPLRIYGTRSQTLDFRIRAQPQSGRLSAVTRTAQESASVTYTPTANVAVKRDHFSYAVCSREGVSAAADVWIDIVDLAPVLVIPQSLDFSPSLVGARTAQEFEIINRGGGIAEGELEVAEPWSIEGTRKYRLGAGEQRTCKIIFAPLVEGTLRGELLYPSEPGRSTALRGIARPPLALSPTALELKQDADSPVREGAFNVINNTAHDQTLRFSGSDRLVFERNQTIPAGGTRNVVVQMKGDDLSALSGEIRAEATSYSALLNVTASAVRPIVRVHPTPIPIETTVRPNAKLAGRAPPDHGATLRSDNPLRFVNADLAGENAGIAPERALVRETTATTATAEWPVNLSPAKRFKAQERRLSLQGQQLKVEWVEHPGFTTETHGDRILATFSGLTPGQPYLMRVVPIASQGEQTDPLLEVQFSTRTAPPHGIRITRLRVLVALFLVCAGVAIWQRTKRNNEFRA